MVEKFKAITAEHKEEGAHMQLADGQCGWLHRTPAAHAAAEAHTAAS